MTQTNAQAAVATKPAITLVAGLTLVKAKRKTPAPRASKYQWDLINEVGLGFIVPEGVGEKGFRTLANKAGAARGKIFSVGRTAEGQLACVLAGFREVDQAAAAAEAADEAAAVAAEQAGNGETDGEGSDTDATADTSYASASY